MTGRLLRYGAAVLFIAILTHIVTILAVPSNAPHMTFDTLAATIASGRTTPLDRWHPPVAGLDPAFVNAVCLMDRTDDGLRLSGTLPDVYWSIAVVADDGRIVSAATRDTQSNGIVDMTIVASSAEDDVTVGPPTVTVDLPSDAGLFLVRAFVPERGDRPAIETALSALDCRRLSSPDD